MVREKWRPVQGYKGVYEVSNLGRVRRIELSRPARRAPGGIIRGRARKGGYRLLFLCHGDRRVERFLHTIVATAFHGPCPRGKECAHIDGNGANSAASNLKWATPLENSSHKVKHGTQLYGSQMPTSKLTLAKIRRAARDVRAGEKIKHIANRLGVHATTLGRALIGDTWKAFTFPRVARRMLRAA